MTALLLIGLLVLGAILVMRMGSNQKPVEQPAVAGEPAPEAVPPAVKPPVAVLAKQPARVAAQVPPVQARSEATALVEVTAAVPATRPPANGPAAEAATSAEPKPVIRATVGVSKPGPPQSVAAPPIEAPAVLVERVEAVEVPVEAVSAEMPAMVAASATPPAGDTSGGENPTATGRQGDERAPGDLILDRKTRATGFDPVVFPHWRHRIHFRCYVCHSQVFEMKRGASEITMATIDQGKFCGKCHNGEVAFNVEFQNCARCHMPSVARAP